MLLSHLFSRDIVELVVPSSGRQDQRRRYVLGLTVRMYVRAYGCVDGGILGPASACCPVLYSY